jgi:hypothetical protein
LLDQRRRKAGTPPPLDAVLPDDPRVRDLRVTPHPLADYDVLARRGPSTDAEEGPHGRG